MKKSNKNLYILLLVFIILWPIQYIEIEKKTKENNKLECEITNMNEKIKKIDNIKSKNEERKIWKRTKKKLEKALS